MKRLRSLLISGAMLPAMLPVHCDAEAAQRPVCARNAQTVAWVDSLAYSFQNMEPAMDAYRAIAADCGWSPEVIAARSTFVQRVMYGESGGCWNFLGGTRNWKGVGCDFKKWGKGSDAGFGQVTDILRKGANMCGKMGICTRWDSIKSPSESMYTFILALNEGKGGWCYTHKGKKSFHITNGDCATWPG